MGARALIRAFAAAVLAAFVLAGFGAACSGPRATATDTGVRPSARSGFYRVETRVVNAGGAGQVEVTFRLRNKADGRIVTQSQSVEL